MASKKIYAVRKGRKIGIYDNWLECKEQVVGFSGAEYKSFKSLEEANQYILGQESTKNKKLYKADDDNKSSEVIVAYVDGSYDVNSNMYGSGVVILWKGEKQVFSFKGSEPQLVQMRNVAGEIIGAQKAMEFAIKNKVKKLIIYYDYEGIEKWCTREWKANKEGTKMYLRACDSIKNKIQLEFVKVKAHSGDRYNDEADMLAKKAIGLL